MVDVEKLLAAIEETERNAEEAKQMRWVFDTNRRNGRSVMQEYFTRHDPAAVLRRCAADLELVEKYRAIEAESARVIERGYTEPDEMVSERLAFEWVIKNRAASYGISVEEETTQ